MWDLLIPIGLLAAIILIYLIPADSNGNHDKSAGDRSGWDKPM